MTVKDLGRFHQRFRQGRVWVDAQREVFGRRAHLDGHYPFGNQLTRAVTDDANAQVLGRFSLPS